MLLAAGCRPRTVGEAVAEFSGRDYRQSTQTNRFQVEVRFLPVALQVLTEARLSQDRAVTRQLLDSLSRDRNLGGLAFLLRVGPSDTGRSATFENDIVYGRDNGFGDWRKALTEYQFGLKEKIWLESDGQKIPLSNYQMENSFGLTPGRSFLLHFPEHPVGRDRARKVTLVLDGIAPGMGRWRTEWVIPREDV